MKIKNDRKYVDSNKKIDNKKTVCGFSMTTSGKILIIIFVAVMGCTSISTVRASEPVRFYISVSGNDSNNGTLAKPFATLEAAKNAIRKYKKDEIRSTNPVEVIIRGGVYYLNETLELKPEDSGTKNAGIVWRAAENEKVVLNGGRVIDGKWEKESDSNIWYVDLPQAKGWKRDVNKPETYQKKPNDPWHFRQLYVDGERAIRARFPNADLQNPFLYAVDGTTKYVELPDGQVKKSWGEEPDAQINIVPKWRFYNQWNDITKVDNKKSIIYIGTREQHEQPMNEGSWFWIEGVKSELDTPGEWYLDSDKGRLYYMPEHGQNPNNLKFEAPYLNRIVYLKGDVEKGTHVQYVSFHGLEFRNTTFTLGQMAARVHTDCAVMFENAQSCKIQNSFFENIGGYALWLHLDCKNNVFNRNTVLNSGGGGVLLTGSRLSYMDDSKIYTPGEAAAKVAPYLTEITHNTVKHCGQIRYYGGGVHIDSRPASMAMMPGNHIAHNHFQDLSRNGIFIFRNQGGNVVEFNEIHDCMQTTIDGACIHIASMNRFNAPNYIMNNYLYDIWGYEQMPEGKPHRTLANGVFLDWATSNSTVKNNVIYNAGGKEIKPIMGNWNLDIENNLTSKTHIEPFLAHEIGPKGAASHCIYPEHLKNIGGVIKSTNEEMVKYSGSWEQTTVSGMRNLFQYNHKIASAENPSECTYQLPVAEPGLYKICLMYFPKAENASNAIITVKHADGEDILEWNFRKGDNLGFAVEVGEYNLDKNNPASVTISNTGADGFIVADGVGFIKVK